MFTDVVVVRSYLQTTGKYQLITICIIHSKLFDSNSGIAIWVSGALLPYLLLYRNFIRPVLKSIPFRRDEY